MNAPATRGTIEALIEGLGRHAGGVGRISLVGGATAVLVLCGWRSMTLDVNMKLHPEPEGIFAAIETLKHWLGLNVELGAPDRFVPALPGWEGRSAFILSSGKLDLFHYDFDGQTLAKLERGHDRDLRDVGAMIARGLVDRARFKDLFESVERDFLRCPAVNVRALTEAVDPFIRSKA